MLYLASQSPSRKRLLQEAGILFTPVAQSANEQSCDWTLPLEQLVESIAVYKMESVCTDRMDGAFTHCFDGVYPEQSRRAHHERPLALSAVEGSEIKQTQYILTADTLGADNKGNIYGKPKDYADAVMQLKSQRNQWVKVATAFCLDRKIFKDGAWHTQERVLETTVSEILFSLEDHEIPEYIEKVGALSCAGAIAIDGFGSQYLRALNGSYSSVIGLPLFEVRQSLKKLGFFK